MNETDQQLWEAFRKGDASSFARLYKKFYPALFFYALKLTQHRELAEDAIHDTFVYIWQNRGRLGEVSSLKFYLLRSVRNQALRSLQANQKTTSFDHVMVNMTFHIQPEELKLTDPSEAVKARIRTALSDLSPRQREIIHLKYFENLEYPEIAELFDMNYQSVVNLVHRAIVKLRKAGILKYLNRS